jgi:hypothetical protein
MSRFGHSNDGDFFGVVHFLLLVGRSGCFAIGRTNALREAFLHDASFADTAVGFVAGFWFGDCGKQGKLLKIENIRGEFSSSFFLPLHGLQLCCLIPACSMKIDASDISSSNPTPSIEQHSSFVTSFATNSEHFPSLSIFA